MTRLLKYNPFRHRNISWILKLRLVLKTPEKWQNSVFGHKISKFKNIKFVCEDAKQSNQGCSSQPSSPHTESIVGTDNPSSNQSTSGKRIEFWGHIITRAIITLQAIEFYHDVCSFR